MEDGKPLCHILVPPDTNLPCPQQIMKDKWINIGYEGEELKPYTEPEEDFGDTKRIGESQGSRFRRLWCSAAEPRLPLLPLLLGSVLPQLITERGTAVEESLHHVRAV